MRIAIRTLNVPQKGAGAFMPTLTRGGAPATNGQNVITGSPGTTRVPSPRPPALSDSELGGPFNQPSSVAPDYIMPSIYVVHANGSLRFPGALPDSNDHVLPVPAGASGRTATQRQHRQRIGGRTATGAVRPFTQWKTYGGTGS